LSTVPAEPRPPLSRDRILRVGVDTADERGVEAVTMRKLGEALGFEAMSLYRHVANKDDLLEGMLDLVLAEWELPAPDGDWRGSVRRSAVSVYGSLRRHRWAASLLLTMQAATPRRLVYSDALLACLRSGGLSPEETYTAYHVLDAHTLGFAVWEISHTAVPMDDPRVAQLMEAIPWDDLPHLREHRDQHMSDGAHRAASAFELGLDLILRGLGG
jgi:AcrR family transcriptional regulator